MKLGQIISLLEEEHDLETVILPAGLQDKANCAGIEVLDCSHDTRTVSVDSLFACLPGNHHDGHDFAGEAIRKGAAALLCQRELPVEDVPQIVVRDVRSVLGHVAAAIHGKPSGSLLMVAVTGTNGKTTTSHMIRSILQERGHKTGMIGTVLYDTGNGCREADRTTPESPDIQRMLAEMVHHGCRACVMETSSHGLVLERLSGCLFDAAVFTNLTEEHLDFHGDMESYFEAKSLLFSRYMKGKDSRAVINSDDPYGKRFADATAAEVVFFGINDFPKRAKNFLKGSITFLGLSGSHVEVLFSKEAAESTLSLELPLVGRYNVYNAMGAAAVGLACGIAPETVRKGLAAMKTVPGRLERWCFEGGPSVIVDYAHTPDALMNVLNAVREVTNGKIWLVFGLGGDRYKANRPVMGRIAAQGADGLVITMDNPRSEDPMAIARSIEKGAIERSSQKPEIILDRREAVFHALDQAAADDVVLVTGKGPERHIIIEDRRIPYNDGETIEEWGKERGRRKC